MTGPAEAGALVAAVTARHKLRARHDVGSDLALNHNELST